MLAWLMLFMLDIKCMDLWPLILIPAPTSIDMHASPALSFLFFSLSIARLPGERWSIPVTKVNTPSALWDLRLPCLFTTWRTLEFHTRNSVKAKACNSSSLSLMLLNLFWRFTRNDPVMKLVRFLSPSHLYWYWQLLFFEIEGYWTFIVGTASRQGACNSLFLSLNEHVFLILTVNVL